MKVVIDMDGEMEQYAPDIRRFVGLMCEKLQKNVHKGRWEHKNRKQCFQGLMGEIRELRESLEKFHEDEAIIRECADVANFAMIIASVVERGK